MHLTRNKQLLRDGLKGEKQINERNLTIQKSQILEGEGKIKKKLPVKELH